MLEPGSTISSVNSSISTPGGMKRTERANLDSSEMERLVGREEDEIRGVVMRLGVRKNRVVWSLCEAGRKGARFIVKNRHRRITILIGTPLWPWLLWNLWKASNKLCFENRSFSEWEVISKSISDAKEWSTAQPNTPGYASLPSHLAAAPITAPILSWSIYLSCGCFWDSVSGNCGYAVLGFCCRFWRLPPTNLVALATLSVQLLWVPHRAAVMSASSSNV